LFFDITDIFVVIRRDVERNASTSLVPGDFRRRDNKKKRFERKECTLTGNVEGFDRWWHWLRRINVPCISASEICPSATI